MSSPFETTSLVRQKVISSDFEETKEIDTSVPPRSEEYDGAISTEIALAEAKEMYENALNDVICKLTQLQTGLPQLEFAKNDVDMESGYGSEYDSEVDEGEEETQVYKSQPKTASAIEAAKELVGKKKIAVLTGSGVSAISGIQTFKGEDEIQRQQDKMFNDYENVNETLTRGQFQKQPNVVWEWHYNFLQNVGACNPNVVHKSIREFQEHCYLNHDLDCQLITECIDGYHTEEFLNSSILPFDQNNSKAFGLPILNDYVQEIQGNAKYMACSRESCGGLYFASPTSEECLEKQLNSFSFVNDLGQMEKIIDIPKCN